MSILHEIRKRARLRTRLAALQEKMFPEFYADRLAVNGHNLKFLAEEREAWAAVERSNAVLPGGPPDVRWRAHIAIWAAKHAARLEGDFVECGVFTAIFTTAILNTLDIGNRRFWLFDTFEGIPVDMVSDSERAGIEQHNRDYYGLVDSEALVRKTLAPFPQVRIVKGRLPETLAEADIDKIAYLSIDMNNAASEMAVIERLWDNLVPGAVIVLDDYGWAGYEPMQVAWDKFCAARGHTVATIPTGQGLIIRS